MTRRAEPTAEEAAAFVAAWASIQNGPTPDTPSGDVPRWRWSGRWWSKPVPLDRARPW